MYTPVTVIPIPFPRSCGGSADTTNAVPQTFNNAPPIPCNALNPSIVAVLNDNAQPIDANRNMNTPMINDFFNPFLPTSLPAGILAAAIIKKKIVAIQFC